MFSELNISLTSNNNKLKDGYSLMQTHIRNTVKKSISLITIMWTFKEKMVSNHRALSQLGLSLIKSVYDLYLDSYHYFLIDSV